MKVTVKDVEHIAGLSRLTIPESEMEKFTEQFNQILNYADILEKIDTEGIKPGVSHEDALKNAPAVYNDGFKVPRVIE